MPATRVLVCCFALAACDLGGQAQYPVPRHKGQTAPQYAETTSIFDQNGLNPGAGKAAEAQSESAGIGVNRSLWRAALESVSMMPLVSEDPVGGVIITDWYSAPTSPNERLKLNVYIFGREIRADSVRVSVYKQRRDKDGNWVDAPAASDGGTDFQNAILARARQLNSAQLVQ